jgi:hypothetical protein
MLSSLVVDMQVAKLRQLPRALALALLSSRIASIRLA